MRLLKDALKANYSGEMQHCALAQLWQVSRKFSRQSGATDLAGFGEKGMIDFLLALCRFFELVTGVDYVGSLAVTRASQQDDSQRLWLQVLRRCSFVCSGPTSAFRPSLRHGSQIVGPCADHKCLQILSFRCAEWAASDATRASCV